MNFFEFSGKKYILRRKIKIEAVDKMLSQYDKEFILGQFKCSDMLKGSDGFYYLLNRIEEAIENE